jgi:hypothetical protein
MSYTPWHALGVAVAAALILRIVRHMGRRGRVIPMPFEMLGLLYAGWAIGAILSPEATPDKVGMPLAGAISVELFRTVSLLWLRNED